MQDTSNEKNVYWQNMDITRDIRSRIKNQKPVTIWFTGLSGSGKTTLANALEKRLTAMGKHTMSLDGDNVRMGLNSDLGFTKEDRCENIRRIAEVAKLMNDAGLIVITSFISPYCSDRKRAREIIGAEHFIEAYVSTSMEVCEKRDVKGLYKKARNGEISDFTGVNDVYEVPEHADLVIDTAEKTVEQCVDEIVKALNIVNGQA